MSDNSGGTGTATRFFDVSLGVFQGGGCRAAAFAGAIQAVMRRGVHFSEVAGTSAGSIVAALVGAGATAEKVDEIIRDLDFKEFLGKPEVPPKGLQYRSVAWVLGRVPKIGRFAPGLSHLGVHSPSYIEHWLERHLRDLLPVATDPVRFKDLSIPTWIVAADLKARAVKVWSQARSPDDSVSRAVSASCSIPFFFQPTGFQYVDGGTISNLPSFVFEVFGDDRDQGTSRILAFSLKADQEPFIPGDAESLVRSLISTIVDGSQKIQTAMVPELHVITIPTAGVKATDFHKMNATTINELVAAGKKAANDFLDAEVQNVRSAPRRTLLREKDEYSASIAEAAPRAGHFVQVSADNTEWLFGLFPTVLSWRMRGVKVDVFVHPGGPRGEQYRRLLLERLGVAVAIVDKLPFEGVLVDPMDDAECLGFVKTRNPTVDSVRYEGRTHSSALEALSERLTELWAGKVPPPPGAPPTLVEIAEQDLVERLRSVKQYEDPEVSLSYREFEVSKLWALPKYVREFKYKQSRQLFEMFDRAGIQPFKPAAVQLLDDRRSFVTPPIVEDHGEQILIQGTTRAVYALRNGIKKVHAILAEGVRAPLPAQPRRLDTILIAGRTLPVGDRYSDFNYHDFRHIEDKMHDTHDLE